MDIEQLMERLGGAGVTVLIKMDDERLAIGAEPWTVHLSGNALGENGFIRADAASLSGGLASVLARLRTRPGEWDWLDQHTADQVNRVLARLAAGTTSREDAADWAMERVKADGDEYSSVPAIWRALKLLAGADLQTAPGVYLHGEEDFQAWLADFVEDLGGS